MPAYDPRRKSIPFCRTFLREVGQAHDNYRRDPSEERRRSGSNRRTLTLYENRNRSPEGYGERSRSDRRARPWEHLRRPHEAPLGKSMKALEDAEFHIFTPDHQVLIARVLDLLLRIETFPGLRFEARLRHALQAAAALRTVTSIVRVKDQLEHKVYTLNLDLRTVQPVLKYKRNR